METGNSLIDLSTADWILGSDESGYGSWAGPLTVCSVLLPRGWVDPGVQDSKKLSRAQRECVYDRYTRATPVPYCVTWVQAPEIDAVGVWQALLAAHRACLTALLPLANGPVLIVVDGFPHGAESIGIDGCIGLPKADQLVPSCSLASILAKVSHDRYMQQQAAIYPGYGFGSHQGYGTAEHQRALAKKGPCPLHRKSYGPIKKLLGCAKAS